MRRIERTVLEIRTRDAMEQLQEEVNTRREQDEFDVDLHWSNQRRKELVRSTFQVLKRMSGSTERCMYCVDSAATDIEHFWPKKRFPERMYVWANLLIACTQCGRHKGSQFPLSPHGQPLLVDPTAEDPWEFLDYDPQTGNINSRFLLDIEDYSEKGTNTVKILQLDQREYIASGYKKTYRRLAALVTAWVVDNLPCDYIEQLLEADDHGLLGWCFRGLGQNDHPFELFRERFPEAWTACQREFN